MNSDVYDSLKLAIELGKWGDGARLDAQQIDFCMQAIILYEAKHLREQDRVGFDLSASCKSKAAPEQRRLFLLLLILTSNSPMNQKEKMKED